MTNLPKIYYVANARMPTPKAHGIQLAKMCEAMIRGGADLKLVVPARKTSPQSLKTFYGLEKDVPTVRIPVFDTYGFGKIGFLFGSSIFMFGSFFFLLWRKLSGEDFIIYTIDIDQFSFIFLPFLCKKYFAEIHDSKPFSLPFEVLFKRAAGIIVINKIIKKEIAKTFGLPEEKIIVQPNGIDLKQFHLGFSINEVREILNLPRGARIALYSGRFYNWKGLGVLVKAAEKIGNNNFIYLVGGSEEEFKKNSGISYIPNNMIFAGGKDYKEMPTWLAAADLLLVLGTKQNDYSYLHTSPMKLTEYMASCRPIIASRTPANLEIVGEEEAVFYEPDDAADLAKKISEVLQNVQKFENRVKNAFKKVQGLSWNTRAEKVLNFISANLLSLE